MGFVELLIYLVVSHYCIDINAVNKSDGDVACGVIDVADLVTRQFRDNQLVSPRVSLLKQLYLLSSIHPQIQNNQL